MASEEGVAAGVVLGQHRGCVGGSDRFDLHRLDDDVGVGGYEPEAGPMHGLESLGDLGPVAGVDVKRGVRAHVTQGQPPHRGDAVFGHPLVGHRGASPRVE